MKIIEPTPIKIGTLGVVDLQELDPDHTDDDKVFTNIRIVGTNMIADYSGGLSLTEYVEAQEYKVTLITKTEWRDLLTLVEQILSDKVKSSIEGDLSILTDIDEDSPLVTGVSNRDILRTGFTAFGDADTLEVTNLTVQLVTQTMFVVGMLATQERVDTILKGVPL